jgi:hypothetical protein
LRIASAAVPLHHASQKVIGVYEWAFLASDNNLLRFIRMHPVLQSWGS